MFLNFVDWRFVFLHSHCKMLLRCLFKWEELSECSQSQLFRALQTPIRHTWPWVYFKSEGWKPCPMADISHQQLNCHWSTVTRLPEFQAEPQRWRGVACRPTFRSFPEEALQPPVLGGWGCFSNHIAGLIFSGSHRPLPGTLLIHLLQERISSQSEIVLVAWQLTKPPGSCHP